MSTDRLFLSVGAMKAGTTWLHQQLASHPDIHFCPEKEIHYFADPQGLSYMSLRGRLDRYQQVVRNLKADRLNPHVQRNLAWYAQTYLTASVSDEWYKNLFENRSPSKRQASYVADFSNLYATLDMAGWDHVRALFPRVRAIYTMRHPAKRLWSHYKFQHQYSGRADELEKITPEKINEFLANPSFFTHTDYAGTVIRLREILAPEQIRFYFFENFRERPLESLRDIEGFLEIGAGKYREEKLTKQVNPSKSLPAPEIFQTAILDYCADQSDKLKALGFELPHSWAQM